jgi:hypothetical protein
MTPDNLGRSHQGAPVIFRNDDKRHLFVALQVVCEILD